MRKTCTKCNIEKEISEFNKNKSSKDGHHSHCRKCTTLQHRENYAKNKDAYKEYYKLTKEARLAYQKDYWEKHPEVRSKLRNSHRVAKISSTIKCLTKEDHEAIKDFYRHAQWLSKLLGKPFHVDHIVPLQHKLVCGLHVPWNLQILPASKNISKSNNFEN